jgi:hypothetical protein
MGAIQLNFDTLLDIFGGIQWRCYTETDCGKIG